MTFSVPGYRLERRLGRGSQGEVWLAERVSSGERVALKWLPLGAPDADAAARSEAALLARLDHPNLIALREFRICEDGCVLVLELAEAGTLANLLRRRGKLTAAEVVATISPVAAALAHAHDAGILHGDVSPANILFSVTGHPKLVDLGVARLIAGIGAGSGLGTPAYLDPTVAAGGAPSLPSDVFSLAAVALHALTGAGPWPVPGASSPSAEQVLAVAASGRIIDLERRLATVPPAMSDPLRRALDRDPIRRGSAAELALDLRAALPPSPVVLAGGRITGTVGRHSVEHRSPATSAATSPPTAAGVSAPPPRTLPPSRRQSLARDSSAVPAAVRRGPATALAADPSGPEFVPADLTRISRPLIRAQLAPEPDPAPAGPLGRAVQHLVGGSRLRAAAVAGSVAVLVAAAIIGRPLLWQQRETSHTGAAATGPVGAPAAAGPTASGAAPVPSAHQAGVASAAANVPARTPGPSSVPASAAELAASLNRLDALRGRAFAERRPDLLAQVYDSPALLAADTRTLTTLVPAGCGLTGLRTSYRSVVVLAHQGDRITIRVSASLAAGMLTCADGSRRPTAPLGPQPLVIDLTGTVSGPDTLRISGQRVA
ncbi:MAG TPA: protein kinase [Jatrophihabitans sp.]|nr:protein kinase [Jatrophihabitans sp.]